MREIKVRGMSCSHCVETVKRAVAAVDPRARVEVDLERGAVRVDGGQADEAGLRKAIAGAGYEPVA